MMDELIETQIELDATRKKLDEMGNKLNDWRKECEWYQTRFDSLERELENLRQSQNGSRAGSTASEVEFFPKTANGATVSSQVIPRTGMRGALSSVNVVRKASFPEVRNPSRPASPPRHDGRTTSAPSNPASYPPSSASASSRPSPASSRETSASSSSVASGEILARMEEIKREYNSLEAIGEANEQRLARNAFIQKHGVVGLICTNSQARMGNPSLKPEFGEAGSPQRGDLWAVPLGNSLLWAVMPRQNLNYESQRNNSGGLGEIFDSNFESGTYSRITLASPAIFQRESDGWVRTPHKGRIVLAR